MLSQKIIREALVRALSTGADYAEVYAEHTGQKTISLVSAKVDKIADAVISGVGIRIFKGTRCVVGSASSLDEAAVLDCASRVAGALEGAPEYGDVVLRERIFGDIHPVRIVPAGVENACKIDYVREMCLAAKEYSGEISQVTGSFLEVDHKILIATSDGLLATDRQIRTRVNVSAIASDGSENQMGSTAPGARKGLELFEDFDPKELGRKAAKQAVTMLHAGYINAGVMPVAIENGFGGVIFHEACGHSLEASGVALGQSQFCGKLGQQIANPKVTAIDDGTIPNGWGSMNIDDEGTPAQRKVLIEKGILKTYMIDKLNGRRMGMESTGSSRRQSYQFAPTSRMTNTYIDAGEDRDEDIIASIEYGLYAKDMGGGSVNPVTGQFNFAVKEGYVIRNGKICEPVRGASLVGKGSDVIMNIDMVGKNVARAQGMCGASSGSIPTDVGQPLIRVSSITVGGR
ncbi:MAG: TldD/PmbA family protein [Butyrivibrio sp.]|nr:TldD/PmbA family protein [Acetatifactor muris]MCM1559384.1 TldD/PmbA family protein [Butyrivibrio sp.]